MELTPSLKHPREDVSGLHTGRPQKARRYEINPQASFLKLPRELRDRIYEYAIPWGNYHIEDEVQNFMSSTGCEAWRRVKGSGLSRKPCRVIEDDHQRAMRWMHGKPCRHDGVDESPEIFKTHNDYHRHCLYMNADAEAAAPRWPFALLFVCVQTHAELATGIYQKCSFIFMDPAALHAFATQTSSKALSCVRDLRLGLRLGSAGGELFHHSPERSVTICRAFSGLRRLHASLSIRMISVMETRATMETSWKFSHWARGLLNFASAPLQEVTIYLESDERNLSFGLPGIVYQRLEEEGLIRRARFIREQLLAPWDRQSVLHFLEKHYEREAKYHDEVCGPHWGHKPLPAPEERVP